MTGIQTGAMPKRASYMGYNGVGNVVPIIVTTNAAAANANDRRMGSLYPCLRATLRVRRVADLDRGHDRDAGAILEIADLGSRDRQHVGRTADARIRERLCRIVLV